MFATMSQVAFSGSQVNTTAQGNLIITLSFTLLKIYYSIRAINRFSPRRDERDMNLADDSKSFASVRLFSIK